MIYEWSKGLVIKASNYPRTERIRVLYGTENYQILLTISNTPNL